MSNDPTLYDYWRSSACYRVRIALHLKGQRYVQKPVHLVRNGGEQHSAEHRALNPQEAVPVFVDGDRTLTQSLAIIEYLEETRREAPNLLPADAAARARVRALALLVACDIHPLNNLRVLQQLEHAFGAQQPEREQWMKHWMHEGFRAFEAVLTGSSETGAYCHGDAPTLADICLVPQIYNANRFGLDLDAYPTIRRINERCMAHPAFEAARPENQPDAV